MPSNTEEIAQCVTTVNGIFTDKALQDPSSTVVSFVQNWCVPNIQFLNLEIVEPYFCLYVGTNLVEMVELGQKAIMADGFCNALYSEDLLKRQQLFEYLYQGADCESSVAVLGYEDSSAATYDPLSSELSTEDICAKFDDEIALLDSVGNNSQIDGLRFSYEVSFTEDVNAQEFNAYASCIEMNAKEDPYASCIKMVQSIPGQFALWSSPQEQDICKSVAADIEDRNDVCGFIAVSTFQVYNEYYQGLSENLGRWMYSQME